MASCVEDRSAALLEAAGSGSLALVQQYAAGGNRVNVADDKGRKPLLLAARVGQVDVVRYFIDGEGTTALIHAAIYREVELVRYLIECGADLHASRL
jgi:ankyrin repeat protein